MGYTITEMKERSKEKGNHFFERDTMRFFRSRIETTANDEGLFITSEQPPDGTRRYTIRKFDYQTGSVDTVGKFMAYAFREDALEARHGYKRATI